MTWEPANAAIWRQSTTVSAFRSKSWSCATLANSRGVAEIDELLSADRDLKELTRVARHQRRSHRQTQRVGFDV